MGGRPTLAVLIALSLLAPVFLAGAQAQNDTNSTSEEDTNDETYEDNETYEEDETYEDNQTYEDEETYEDDGSDSWVDCWEDGHGASCEAVAPSREDAYNLLEEAEADGRMSFSLDDDNVECEEDSWENEVSVRCHEEEDRSYVECWEDRGQATCESVASTREDARAALQAADEVSFDLDDPYTDCHTEEWENEVSMMCTQVDSLVECWEDDHGPVCEARGETIEEARAKFDQEAQELPFALDDPNVRCEEEQHDREATFICFEEPEPEPPERHDAREGPAGEPDCTPRPDEGIVECAPPPECEGQLGQTRECTPPPECEIVDPDTVTCPMGTGAEAGDGGPHPDCEPAASDPNAMVCRPPPECEDKMGETAACTAPPECQPQGDGTFLCKLEGDRDARGDAQVPHEEGPEPSAVEGLDEDLRDAVRDALSGFREELKTLRDEYQDGKADLAERYEQTKDELRADYRECLDELDDGAERVDELEQELACKQEARAALQDEREVLLAERDLLREDLLSQAQSKQFHTCQNLQESLHGILMDHGIFEPDLGAYLGPEDLGLCAGILLDAEVDGADIGDWGGGATR